MICVVCGLEKGDYTGKSCDSCKTALKSYQNSKELTKNDGWMDIANDAEIELHDRQPEEGVVEWGAWCIYRDCYPFKKPTLSETARLTGLPYTSLRYINRRWNWPIRMQSWVKKCDQDRRTAQTQNIIALNERQSDMANQTLDIVQDQLNQYTDQAGTGIMKPTELKALMEIGLKMKRESLDEMPDIVPIGVDRDVEIVETSKDELTDILKIMQKAGTIDSVETVTATKVTYNKV